MGAPIDTVYFALSHETRREIHLELLRRGELSVGALAERYPVSLNAISKHIKVLEKAGLVTKSKRGRETLCRGELAPIERVREHLEGYRAFWTSRLDALAKHLEGETNE